MSMIWLSQLLIPDGVSRSLYEELKATVEQRIIPKLEKEGFQQCGHPKWLKPNRREKAYNPHGIFRRPRDGWDDMIEIVYDDRKYPEFHLFFGIAPHEGVKVWGKPFPFEDMGVAESPVSYSLSSSGRSFRPFAVVWPLMGAKNIPRVVLHGERALPQVFEWFESRTVGPNMFGGENTDDSPR